MSKLIRYGCLCLLGCLLLTGLSGQSNLVFNHLTVEDGLSQGSVICITQDASGFIWIGTMDGLNRFDGRNIKIFKSFYRNNPLAASLKMGRLVADKYDNIWIGTDYGLYRYNTRVDLFSVFYHNEKEPASLSDNNIKALYSDRKGYIWIGTEKGLNRINPAKAAIQFELVTLKDNRDSKVSDDIQAVYEDHAGNIWVGTTEGVTTIGKQSDKNHASILKQFSGIGVTSIAEDFRHDLWIGTNLSGLYKINHVTSEIANFQSHNGSITGLVSNVIRKVLVDKKGRVWVGTLKGLNVYDETRNTFDVYTHKPEDAFTLNYNSIHDIYEDAQGNVWVGTFFGGVNIAEAITTGFKVYKNEAGSNSVSSNVISSVVGDSCKNLWIGTEAEGLNYFNRTTNTFTRYRNEENNPNSISANLIKVILRDSENNIWVALNNGVLERISKDYKRFEHFATGGDQAVSSSKDIVALIEDKNGMRLWVGKASAGLYLFDKKTLKFKKFEEVYPGLKLSSDAITSLFEDSRQNIWIGTKRGLNMLETAGNKRILTIFHQRDYPKGLQTEYINCITADKKGVIWLGTYRGLSFYDPVKNTMAIFNTPNDFVNDKIIGMVVDDDDNLWISTNHGLSRLDSTRTKVNTYTKLDGLPGDVFNYNSFYKDYRGSLFFGGFNGFVEFSPSQMKLNHEVPKLVLTGLTVNGNAVNPRDGTNILTGNISMTRTIELTYDQNILAVNYAVINYIKPGKNKSVYMLTGYDKDWVPAENHTAAFTNLPPGSYTLYIKGCNNDGVWSAAAPYLTIIIHPPFWKTWWAYTLYILLFGSALFGFFHFFNSREKLKRNLQYEHDINVKQQELHQMKMDFFTHISHEIRTPLTLIVGPVEMLTEQPAMPVATSRKLLSSIKSNTERLLKLTNDLLAFRKTDTGYTQLHIQYGDIVDFCRTIFDKFAGEALHKAINYDFYNSEEKIGAYYDPGHMEIVFSNLLANALKFTPKGGKVSMRVGQTANEVRIWVTDNGIGIPAAEQDKIFIGFYQVKTSNDSVPGSGIGLVFSKSLVELHKGSINFTSGKNNETGEQETSFVVTLKTGKEHFEGGNLII